MHRWSTDRTEAFSDGVFAIAITLLVLDIRIPPTEFNDLWGAIRNEWPAYVGYVTSFAAIGAIWLGHHAIFDRLQWLNRGVIRLNLLLLGVVAFLPFPTRLVAEAANLQTGAERTAVLFYAATQFVIVLIAAALWRSAVRDPECLKPEVTQAEIAAINRATTPNVATYGIATGVAVGAPKAAAILLLVSAIVSISRARGDSAHGRHESSPRRGQSNPDASSG